MITAVDLRMSEVASAVAGRLIGSDVTVTAVSIDSRSIEPGALFVPIVADRDGHEFIPAALAGGAIGYLTADRQVRPPEGAAAVVVDDTMAALAALGRHARGRIADTTSTVVGVTGSVGKTSVKDMLAAVLAADRVTWASAQSFNNELGVPVTLVNAPADARALVIEMGARGAGHIKDLCDLAQPTMGVVTRVAAVHTELFGSLDDVARAKGELVEALPAGGTAVLNAADPLVAAMASRTRAEVVRFGDGGDVRAEAVGLDDELRPSFRLVSPWGSAEVSLRSARGLPMVENALAASAAALAAGVPQATVVAALEGAALSPWRMELTRSAAGGVILNDAYNANPTSVAAALRSLAALPARRRVAVLGLMAELGPDEEAEHRRIGDLARELGIEVVAIEVPAYGGTPVDGVDQAAEVLGEVPQGTAVLVKASRVVGLERLAHRLVAE